MSPSEYAELVSFLGRKFDLIDARFASIDARFDAVDRRFDAVDQRFDRLEARVTRVEIVVEDSRHRIEILAEGLSTLNGKFEDLRRDMDAGFAAVRQEIRVQGDAFHRRISRLEERFG